MARAPRRDLEGREGRVSLSSATAAWAGRGMPTWCPLPVTKHSSRLGAGGGRPVPPGLPWTPVRSGARAGPRTTKMPFAGPQLRGLRQRGRAPLRALQGRDPERVTSAPRRPQEDPDLGRTRPGQSRSGQASSRSTGTVPLPGLSRLRHRDALGTPATASAQSRTRHLPPLQTPPHLPGPPELGRGLLLEHEHGAPPQPTSRTR